MSDARRRFGRRLVIALLAIAAAAGCGGGGASREATPDGPSAADMARRQAHRERLRDELGAAYDEPVSVAAEPARLVRGARLYRRVCSACHGEDGRGAGPTAQALIVRPVDLTDPEHAAFFSDRARLEIIRGGLPGTPMRGWQGALAEEDVMNLFLFVRSLARTTPGAEAAR